MDAKEIDTFEMLEAQLGGLYEEIQTLVKKSPNDALNAFKLGLVNGILQDANAFLEGRKKPIAGFSQFDEGALPTNSDVLMVLSQYLSCLEKIRADNISFNRVAGEWAWNVTGKSSRNIRTGPPKKLGK